jgi:predicted ATPase/DNA-binding winged helix-turn-helix (wHTH) protein
MERVAFGEFVLDSATRELLREGAPVRLSPKAFQLLGALVERRPAALSKQELQERLWPGTFVVDKNLTNLIAEIRAAIGDDAKHPRFIKTVSRFGYAFGEPAPEPALPVAERSYGHNLPEQGATFIGREREIADILRLLQSVRLLTLTGIGGCGKTRLALALAGDLVNRFHDGVWMVDLSSLTDSDLVSQSIASVLQVRPAPDRALDETLTDAIRNRHLLLLLDNCEHLLATCADIAGRLLRTAPRLTILATSRERLGIAGETLWPVSPLSVPSSASDVIHSESGRLFMVRAAAVDPSFHVSPSNVTAVATVCQALEGIPLAIELAAARLKALPVEEIRLQLGDRVLASGTRTLAPRQQTLEATIDWSYSLLDELERRLFCRLSVFAGGWTLDAAQAVCSDVRIGRDEVAELLSHLVDKSLVAVDKSVAVKRRYRLLETVRQYGAERLSDFGEGDDLRDRHWNYFAALTEQAAPDLTTLHQIRWLELLKSDHDNLRAALQRRVSLELAVNLFWFWLKLGHYREGQQSLERTLALTPSPPHQLRAKALMALGTLLFFQGAFAKARSLLKESAVLGAESGDLSTAGFSLGIAALAAMELQDFTDGMRLAEESRTAARASATPWVEAPAVSLFAYQAMYQGDLDRAARLHEEALELTRAQGERWGMGISLHDLALLRLIQERHSDARALCAEAISVAEQFNDRRGIAWSLGVLSGVAAAEQRGDEAAVLCGAMEGLLESAAAPIQPSFKELIVDRYLENVRRTAGDKAFEEALAKGRALSLPQVMELARAETLARSAAFG